MLLPPIIHKDEYTQAIESELAAYLGEVLFTPLSDLRDNALPDPLVAAIFSGRVWYEDGKIRGQFSSAISKRVHELGGYATPLAQFPDEIRSAFADAKANHSANKTLLLGALAAIESNIAILPEDFSAAPIKAIAEGAQGQFDKSLEGTEHDPIPSDALLEQEDEAGNRLTKAQQALALVGVSLLRSAVSDSTTGADLLERIGIVETQLKRRASALAEGEASRIVSGVRSVLAVAFGLEEYQWVTMHDSKVRHDHRLLDGRIFRFDDPPIVDNATGRRGNPGDDYNCRCYARPIFLP